MSFSCITISQDIINNTRWYFMGTISVGVGMTSIVVGRLLTSNEPTIEESIRTKGSNRK